jgi:protoporphyrinogen oxidase
LKRFGILGGGLAGLSLSYFLGPDSEVLEKEDQCGGLCRSFQKDGFTFDLGGHIMFSKDQEILDLNVSMLQDNVNKFIRHNSIWFKDRFVKYPFENGIGVLDPEDKFDCLYNFLENPQRPQNNFEDWIYNTFGKGLSEKYLIPYNEKIWKTPACQMSTEWVGRIPKPPLEDIVKAALGIETEGYTHQLHFYYPKQGGFQSLPKAFEALVNDRVTRSFPIRKIRRTDKGWLVSNGKQEREFALIVCAMPIFDFVHALVEVPPAVQRAVDGLRYNSLIVVLVGTARPGVRDRLGVYVPQSDLPFHRINFFDYFGDHYVPSGCSSIVAEITTREGDQLSSLADSEITAKVIDGLAKERFIDKKEVIVTAVKRAKYAYPVYDLERQHHLDVIHSYCREEKIELCGRFAEFVYYNSDGVVRSAKTIAARLLDF